MSIQKTCPYCGGRGYITHIETLPDCGQAWTKRCIACEGAGFILYQETNADRFRAMSDEELAILLCRMMDCSICKRNIQKDGECDNYSADGLSKAVLNWLQQPAEEDT